MFKVVEHLREVKILQYDYSKLKGRIIEKLGSQHKFAKSMSLTEKTISSKLNNEVFWKQNEISKACDILDIKEDEIKKYFFKLKVQ